MQPTKDRPDLRERRRSVVPPVRYAEGLPVTARKDDIAAAIRDHQVVVVAGETGSGKTTQLPKICLELGRGIDGTIGHTQPRRIAARTVAERIAAELDVPLGGAIGYKVRFTDTVSDTTLVKVMTDGILLAEIHRDRMLRAYDTIIIDEAHERSLNIDFLLGYLKNLLSQRPDLKLIITSATIDTERFSAHFDGAPVVEVSGRTFPVEVRYRPPEGDGTDQVNAITDAVAECCAEGPGDVLVFLSGEREIRDTADALTTADLDDDLEVLPLYARLSASEQHRVFQDHPGRRVVLATNVAETSLTVPGIRYVVDPGTARISRYSRRTKVQRLPIEAVSQASANQRAGRCGRVAPGICIRLYGEEDFAGRPEFTDPEILRTNLASVILAMAAVGLGDVAGFPFVDPPDARAIADGVALLHELGALDERKRGERRPRGATDGPADGEPGLRLTRLGHHLARLPVDPRLGRMVLEAERTGALREVTVLAAALSIQDPRERPADRAQAAAEAHGRFVDRNSDFTTLLNLWTHIGELQRELSGNQFRKRCRAEFLNYLRIREWQDVAAQIRHVLREAGVRANRQPAPADAVHRALLAGLLSQVGVREGESREFLGARQARFTIAAGSALAKKPPRWVMAGELVETNRLWARTVARIEPAWVERAATHLVKRSYGEPSWDAARGTATTTERVTLYGIPVVTARRIPYARVDRAESRDLFLEHALVHGDWQTHHELPAANRAVLEEARSRSRSSAGGDEATLFAFYDDRVPLDVVSARHFDSWWNKARAEVPELLTLTPEHLGGPGDGDDAAGLPDRWCQDGVELEVSYAWQPGEEGDGVSVTVPLAALAGTTSAGFDWQVPGRREELVVALIRTLPKELRRQVVPAPTYARAFLDRAGPGDGDLVPVLARTLARMTGEPIRPGSFSLANLPAHLRITFVVTDDRGRRLASGQDLDALRTVVDGRLRRAVVAGARHLERTGITAWDFGDLPETVSREWSGHTVSAWVTLVDRRDSVGIRVVDSPTEAGRLLWAGNRRLLALTVPAAPGPLARRLREVAGLAVIHAPGGDISALIADCVEAATGTLLDVHGGPVRTAAEFSSLQDGVRVDLAEVAARTVADAGRVLQGVATVDGRLRALDPTPAYGPSLADVRRQLGALVRPGFVSEVGPGRLADLVRYLRAADRRLDQLPPDPARDQRRMLGVLRLAKEARSLTGPDAERLRWMLEELRVSVWAQSLGTPTPVSEDRVRRTIRAAS